MGSRLVRTNAVTVNDVLDGHKLLEIDCVDRVYLTLSVPNLVVGGQVVSFLTVHEQHPIPSPALLERRGQAFRRAVTSFAEANDIPVLSFAGKRDKGRPGVLADSPWPERKIDQVMPLMRKAAATGRSQVVAIGVAQEYQRVFTGTKDQTPTGAVWFSYNRTERRVTCYYFYVWDEALGPAFIKICAYFPYPGKIWFNGHEWAKRQAARAGLSFKDLSNGFASCEDAAALQEICDRLGPGQIRVFAERWRARLPLPFTHADRQAGYWWDISMRQVEVAKTITFTAPRHARAFFEALAADNLDIGRPDNMEIIFNRQVRCVTKGVFRTAVDRDNDGVVVNAFYRHSRIKTYLKDGRALRVETVINDACKAHRFEPTCARWRLKFTGRRAGCLGPGRPRRGGLRRVRAESFADEFGIQARDQIDEAGCPQGPGSGARRVQDADEVLVGGGGAAGPGVSRDDHVRVAGAEPLAVVQAALQRLPGSRVEGNRVRAVSEDDGPRAGVDVGDLEVAQLA
jgi:hypothetical protein